jgi:hypothetical protein
MFLYKVNNADQAAVVRCTQCCVLQDDVHKKQPYPFFYSN